MNSEELEKLRKQKEAISKCEEDLPDSDDLKTPTIEELAFPGQKVS